MVEIEVKIRVNDVAAVHQAILSSGGMLEKDRHLEENTLFDLRSRDLTKKGSALRVRRTGRKVYLAFKGPAQKSRRFKIREEHETEVRNEKQLGRILRSLGYVAVFRYQKYRTAFRRGRLRIMLDETEAGCFLEFEGERSDIIRYARVLGFSSRDLIKKDYVQILKAQEKKV